MLIEAGDHHFHRRLCLSRRGGEGLHQKLGPSGEPGALGGAMSGRGRRQPRQTVAGAQAPHTLQRRVTRSAGLHDTSCSMRSSS